MHSERQKVALGLSQKSKIVIVIVIKMNILSQTVQFDADLLRKYDQPLPRYTSYPPATELTEDFKQVDFRAAIAK
jgi:hypothetical protein